MEEGLLWRFVVLRHKLVLASVGSARLMPEMTYASPMNSPDLFLSFFWNSLIKSDLFASILFRSSVIADSSIVFVLKRTISTPDPLNHIRLHYNQYIRTHTETDKITAMTISKTETVAYGLTKRWSVWMQIRCSNFTWINRLEKLRVSDSEYGICICLGNGIFWCK